MSRAGIAAGGIFYNVPSRNRCPIEKLMLKLTTKSQIEFGQALLLADSSKAADSNLVRQPCGGHWLV